MLRERVRITETLRPRRLVYFLITYRDKNKINGNMKELEDKKDNNPIENKRCIQMRYLNRFDNILRFTK